MKPGIAFPHLKVLEPGEYDRTKRLGGSKAASVMGFGAYGQTPYTTWQAMTGRSIESIDPDKQRFFERRKRFEPLIVQMLQEEFDAEIVSLNEQYIDGEHNFLTAEIDFAWRDPETGLIENGEIKTVYPLAFSAAQGWGDAGTDEVPIHYAAQVVHGMGVTGARKAILAALVGFDTMLFYKFERDDAMIAEMRARCEKFWKENVLQRIEPDPLVLEDLQRMMLMKKGRPVELDLPIVNALTELKQIGDKFDMLNDRERELKFEILDFVRKAWDAPSVEELPADHALLMLNGQTIAKYGRQTHTSLDQKKLKADKPDLVKEYTRSKEIRVLRHIKPK